MKFFKSLSKICNIAHVKTTNNSDFFLKNNNYEFRSFIFNIKCTNFNTNFYLNFLTCGNLHMIEKPIF